MKLIKLKGVQALTTFSKSKIYNDINDGLLPRPVQTGLRGVAWPEQDINIINKARIAGLDNDAIKRMVEAIHWSRERLAQKLESNLQTMA